MATMNDAGITLEQARKAIGLTRPQLELVIPLFEGEEEDRLPGRLMRVWFMYRDDILDRVSREFVTSEKLNKRIGDEDEPVISTRQLAKATGIGELAIVAHRRRNLPSIVGENGYHYFAQTAVVDWLMTYTGYQHPLASPFVESLERNKRNPHAQYPLPRRNPRCG